MAMPVSRLSDGRELRGKLLVAADGAASKTRELLGIGTAGHAYHQDALVAHVRTAKPHRNTAWQRFLSTGPLAFLPLPDGRSSIVWSIARAEAARLRVARCARRSAPRSRAASGGVLGEVEFTTPLGELSAQASVCARLCAAARRAARRCRARGAPAGGAGTESGTAGLRRRSPRCSARPPVRAQLGEYRLLRRYERWRKSENLLAAAALDGLERLFSSAQSRRIARLRTAGLDAVGKLPSLRRRFAQRALGIERRHSRLPADRGRPGACLSVCAARPDTRQAPARVSPQPIDLGGADEIVLRQAADRMGRED